MKRLINQSLIIVKKGIKSNHVYITYTSRTGEYGNVYKEFKYYTKWTYF